MKRTHRRPSLSVTAFLVLLALFGSPPTLAQRSVKELMEFAAEMARQGNWREAEFRWLQAEAQSPDDAKILNNLAVTMEARGEPDRAAELYERALKRSGGDEQIEANARQFEYARRLIQSDDDEAGSVLHAAPGEGGGKNKGKSKTVRVSVPLPVPARIDLTGIDNVLVASFLVDDNPLLDVNREMVRFIRGEYRKGSSLEVLDVTPAPAVPEQTLEDLAANREFWKHLGREYQAELIVSGAMLYGRFDASGFREVDRVSARTGQKVRRTEFVEQERFDFELDVLFLDGATGTLLHRDRLSRSLVFEGSQNDPITAFYMLAESLTDGLLSAVQQQVREEPRVIFRR